MSQILYVNPTSGNDGSAGSQQAPVKTITKAIQLASAGAKIQLISGTYNAASGETFPLFIPSGVTVIGTENNKGSAVLIEGSGNYLSRTFAGQNVTFVMANAAELRGVTVVNQASRGTAVWVESTSPVVANCTFIRCKREGLFATGDANPVVVDNVFTENAANGISIARNSKGDIRGNICYKTGYGIAVSDSAAPILIDNKISENRSGIVISGSARPILRSNLCDRNTDDGITIISSASPDLGTNTSPGNNILRSNGKFDLQNASSNKIIAIGNQIDPTRVSGNIELINNQSPSPSPTPAPSPTPTPVPIPVPSPNPSPNPIPVPSPNPSPTPTPTPIPAPDPDPEPIPVPIPSPSPNPIPTPSPTPTPGDLTDVTGHWAEAFIRELNKLDIITGFKDKTFKPDATMTRAQYAALLVKAFNPSAKRQAIKFRDVPESFWASKVIQQAYQGQFLSGYPDNSFHPNENIQRVQILVSLVNGLGLTTTTKISKAFEDQNKIPNYALDEIAIASSKRIIVNYPKISQLNPTRDATRGEVAAMVYQALVNAGRVAVINSPYIVG
jgi:parallel beta-helix repeat protein